MGFTFVIERYFGGDIFAVVVVVRAAKDFRIKAKPGLEAVACGADADHAFAGLNEFLYFFNLVIGKADAAGEEDGDVGGFQPLDAGERRAFFFDDVERAFALVILLENFFEIIQRVVGFVFG